MEKVRSGKLQIPGTIEDTVKFNIPVESEEYQAFLEANKRREEAREEYGGPEPEAESAYLEAVKRVVELGRKLYAGDRSTPI